MNSVTFNEPFAALAAAPGLDPHGRTVLLETLEAPLVLWEHSGEAPPEECWEATPRDERGFPKLPFPCFRAGITVTQRDGTVIRFRMVVRSGDGAMLVFSRIDGFSCTLRESRDAMARLLEQDVILTAGRFRDGVEKFGAVCKKSGREAAGVSFPWVEKVIESTTMAPLALLAVDFANRDPKP